MGKQEKKDNSVVKRITKAIGGDKLILLGAIVVVFVLFTCLNPNFLTKQNMLNLLVASSLVGMVAVGHTYLIIAGQNDLSPVLWQHFPVCWRQFFLDRTYLLQLRL